jgi:hypothetical protein
MRFHVISPHTRICNVYTPRDLIRYKERRLMLFNDMLLLTKDKGGKAEPSERLSYKSHLNFEDQVCAPRLGAAAAAAVATAVCRLRRWLGLVALVAIRLTID